MYTHLLLDERESSITYYFDTDLGQRYFVRFTKATHLFNLVCKSCQRIYEVSFEKESIDVKSSDSRVKSTIANIVRNFIDEYRSPVTYVCDNSDNREMCRMRLFLRWFQEYTDSDYQNDYRVFELEDYTLVVGIMSFSWDKEFDNYFDQIEIY